jgi:hypothetical protein
MNTGWESVTDVACPGCKVGILRWAEAGYVPGWRICDVCERHYQGEPPSGKLVLKKRAGKRVTKKWIEKALLMRKKNAELQLAMDIRLANEAAKRDLKGCYHGKDWHAIGTYGDASWLGPKVAGAYWAAWRDGATEDAVRAIDIIGESCLLPGWGIGHYGIPFRPKVCAISKDGASVVVYRDGGGGTYRQSLEDALAGKVVSV